MVAPVSSQSAYMQYQAPENLVKKEEILQAAEEENLMEGELKGGSHGDFSHAYESQKGKCCIIL